MDANRIAYLDLRTAHFLELETLPPLHRDPFDRMLIAQARAEGIPIVSVDSKLSAYGVTIL